MPDELSSEDYFFFFSSLCVRLLSGGTGRYRYSDGSQRGPGHCAFAARRNRAFWHCRYRKEGGGGGGTITRGLQAQITFIKFINSKSGFKPASSPYKHLLPVLRKSGFSMHKLILHAAGELICAQLCLLGWIFYEKPTALLPLLRQQSPPLSTHTHTSVKISFPCINTKSNALIL